MAVSHQQDETLAPANAGSAGSSGAAASIGGGAGQPGGGSGGGDQNVTVPTRLDVPPEVQAAYSGIRIIWKDATNGKTGTLEIPLGGAAPIPDSPLAVGAQVYLPAFTMSGDAITSTGIAEENPAARIDIAEDGKQVFGGWIFKRFPDVHPFQHPRFSLRLEGGVPSGAGTGQGKPAPAAGKKK
jgi:hypothetical protein